MKYERIIHTITLEAKENILTGSSCVGSPYMNVLDHSVKYSGVDPAC